MLNIPVITSKKTIFDKIVRLVKAPYKNQVKSNAIFLDTTEKAIEYLTVEMPEIVYLNFSDEKLKAMDILHHIIQDSWLLHGGIIGFCQRVDEANNIENIRGTNIIAILNYSEIEDNLPKVIAIIKSNKRILFQREIGRDLIQNISGSFKLKNDVLEAKCYVNLVCNFLYNANKLDANKKFNLQLALHEMLLNAIEHGNCNISYKEKSEWLENHRSTNNLIEQRKKDPKIDAKRVTFEYTITPSCAKFLIADEGKGFKWREVKDARKKENVFELHGRGILITKTVVENLVYNEEGNEVRFEISYESGEADIAPGLFAEISSRKIHAGEIIFQQGEPSNFLYYIVKGKFNVIVNKKIVSFLTADDIFVGEMSFLLNNQRSATVQAETDGKLIAVSKKEFIEAIKKKPHYALFLARLLAQRIERLNASK